jgi:DNA-binding NarL/FixJ family response regulator
VLKTLIVEDSAIFRKTFRDALCRLFPSMAVQEAEDGAEALKTVETFLPQLVFMDIKLPGESGIEVTRRIKAAHPDIFVVILTHYDLPEYRDAAREGGADNFMAKGSLSLEQVAELVKSVALHKQDP